MNERTREGVNHSFELPEQEGWEKKLEKAIEGQQGSDSPSVTKRQDSAGQTQDNTSPQSINPVVAQVSDDSHAPMSLPAAPVVAGDGDRIEKHWLERTRDAIAKTKDDPHAQKKQLSLVKAEYLKARFGKIIKVEEAA